MQIAFLLVLLVTALVLLVTQWVRIEVTSIGIIVALSVSGILDVEQALSGFSNAATITVVSMLVISAGLERAGVVDWASANLARWGRSSRTRLLALLALPTAGFSAFMNNTPVVALMMPVALSLSQRFAVPASKLLIPLSYFAILGGTCTLIGTSTNILVDSLARQAGAHGLGMFDFTGLGLCYLAVGVVYVLLMSGPLLPVRTALGELLSARAPGRFTTEVVVPPDSKLTGRTIGETFGAGGDAVLVLELVRDEEARLNPASDTRLCGGDMLLLESSAKALHHLLGGGLVEHGTVVADDERIAISRVDLRIAEAVITPTSGFVDRKTRELGLTRRFGVTVLAIRRLGRRHQYNLRELRLRPGDVLLVQGEPVALRTLQEQGDVLLVEGIEGQLTFPRRAPAALAVLLSVVGLAAAGVAPIVVLALAGAAAMILLRCLDARDGVRAVDPAVLLLLAGTIPLGMAMERTGLAGMLAGQVVEICRAGDPRLLVGAVYVVTSLLTEILSNNACAVLMVPIVLAVAEQTHCEPKGLLMAVAFGASASFSTPIGYQTNTLVMGPGGYRFRDFVRFGLPMNLLLAGVATLLIPSFWPL